MHGFNFIWRLLYEIFTFLPDLAKEASMLIIYSAWLRMDFGMALLLWGVKLCWESASLMHKILWGFSPISNDCFALFIITLLGVKGVFKIKTFHSVAKLCSLIGAAQNKAKALHVNKLLIKVKKERFLWSVDNHDQDHTKSKP